jgi:hypothetical protein
MGGGAGEGDYIYLAPERVKWWTLMNLPIPETRRMAWLLTTSQFLKETDPLIWLIFLIVNRSSETIRNVRIDTNKATKIQTNQMKIRISIFTCGASLRYAFAK